VIRIYGEVANDGIEDPLSALRQALVHSLADRRINAFVTISPVRPPPPPRVDVQIVGGDSGNDAVAYFFGVGSGQGWMVVDVRMHTPDGRGFAFRGRVEGWGEELKDAATEIGRAIAEELASGGTEGP
jgi:hypothetical protein